MNNTIINIGWVRGGGGWTNICLRILLLSCFLLFSFTLKGQTGTSFIRYPSDCPWVALRGLMCERRPSRSCHPPSCPHSHRCHLKSCQISSAVFMEICLLLLSMGMDRRAQAPACSVSFHTPNTPFLPKRQSYLLSSLRAHLGLQGPDVRWPLLSSL